MKYHTPFILELSHRIVLGLFFFISWNSYCQEYEFSKVTTESGLSHSTVYDITQGSNGLIWIATREGLNRYDSYGIKTYYTDSLTNNGLASNQINNLLTTATSLWVGTNQGLNKYIPEKDSFKRITGAGLENNYINNLFEAEDGTVFVCTDTGLFTVDERSEVRNIIKNARTRAICEFKTNVYWLALKNKILLINNFGEKIKEYTLPQDNVSSGFAERQTILNILKDTDGEVWVGTSRGLFHFNASKDIFEPSDIIQHFSGPDANVVRDIAEDHNGNLWIGAESGVFVYNKSREKSKHYSQSFHNSPNSLSDKSVYSLFVSKENIVWIGTYFGGVNYAKPISKGFYKILPNDFKESIGGKAISQIIQTSEGTLWIGTEDGGITIYDRKKGSFEYVKHVNGSTNSLSSNNVHALHEDNKGSIWIGTFLGGLNKYDKKSGEITVYKNRANDSTTLSNNYVYSVLQDKTGKLWVGTQYGLNIFDYSTEKFDRFKPRLFGDKFIYDIHEDSNQNLWFCTRSSGIYRMEQKSGKISHYTVQGSKNNGLSSNEIISAYEDEQGQMWFGSLNGGLVKWDGKTELFHTVRKNDGLPNDNVYGVLEDPNRGYWITTNKGMTLYNPTSSEFRNFTTADGLPANQFNFKSFFKDNEGWMYFGTVNGLTYFHPDSLSIEKRNSNIYLNNLKIFNQDVGIGGNSPLKKSIDQTDTLELRHYQNAITFEYAGIDFLSEGNNSYAYYLEGFEHNWNLVENKRTATYTNLPHGDYIFHLKSNVNSIKDLAESNGRKVYLSIHPPFWKTNWAFALYALLIALAVYGFYRFTKFIHEKNIALKISEVEREKVAEISKHRLNFFTFISHEFKTPLTLIIASIEQFFQKNSPNKETPEELLSIKRSAGKLHHLVQQLMHFRQIETDHAKLALKKGDIVLFITDTFKAFDPLFEYKNQHSCFESNLDAFYCHFDADKLETILTNLLSNAIKNTDEQGQIKLVLFIHPPRDEKEDAAITIEISDTGNGFDEHEQEVIFTPFYTNSQQDAKKTGTGIGLALVKSLVAFLNGRLALESKIGKGTTCKINLPLLMDHSTGKDDIQDINGNRSINIPKDLFLEKDRLIDEESTYILPEELTILIAEDNDELMKFLSKHFSHKYKVIMAKDGMDALKKVERTKPDIILSDIKMPNLDGIELCKRLKSDPKTSHIPFILLTAETTEYNKIEALSVGANAYMAKPFNLKELDLLVRNLLEASKSLQYRFSKLTDSESDNTIPVNNKEREFLLKVTNLVEANYDDADFTIERLAEMIGISRSLLHLKMKKTTGMSASEFLKQGRMDKAMEMLKKGYSISEIAYKVGYNDPNYFSRVFKKEHGVSPTEYLLKQKVKI